LPVAYCQEYPKWRRARTGRATSGFHWSLALLRLYSFRPTKLPFSPFHVVKYVFWHVALRFAPSLSDECRNIQKSVLLRRNRYRSGSRQRWRWRMMWLGRFEKTLEPFLLLFVHVRRKNFAVTYRLSPWRSFYFVQLSKAASSPIVRLLLSSNQRIDVS